MGSIQDLKRAMNNLSVSDEELVEILKKELSDEHDFTPAETREIGKLGEECDRKRPAAMKKFREWFLETHGKECPACRELQKSQK